MEPPICRPRSADAADEHGYIFIVSDARFCSSSALRLFRGRLFHRCAIVLLWSREALRPPQCRCPPLILPQRLHLARPMDLQYHASLTSFSYRSALGSWPESFSDGALPRAAWMCVVRAVPLPVRVHALADHFISCDVVCLLFLVNYAIYLAGAVRSCSAFSQHRAPAHLSC